MPDPTPEQIEKARTVAREINIALPVSVLDRTIIQVFGMSEAAEQFENEILAPPIARALAEAEEKWRKEAQDYIAERCYCVCHTPVASRSSCEHCKGVNEVTYTNVKRWGDALEAERDRLREALEFALEALGDPDDANKRLAAVLKGNAALPKEGA